MPRLTLKDIFDFHTPRPSGKSPPHVDAEAMEALIDATRASEVFDIGSGRWRPIGSVKLSMRTRRIFVSCSDGGTPFAVPFDRHGAWQ